MSPPLIIDIFNRLGYNDFINRKAVYHTDETHLTI